MEFGNRVLRQHHGSRLATLAVVACSAGGLALAAAPVAGARTAHVGTPPATCMPAPDTGLTAAVVATSGQTIVNQTINATGCDIGIYVGVGVSNVTIANDTVSGANYQGILAQGASNVQIVHSLITNNAFNTQLPAGDGPGLVPGPGSSLVAQAFAISLFGVSDSSVVHNVVTNNGRGGVGIMDNGPTDVGVISNESPAGVIPNGATPVNYSPFTTNVPSTNDRVIGNFMSRDYGGCSIVLATQNLGGSMSHLQVLGNTIAASGTTSNEPIHALASNGRQTGAVIPGQVSAQHDVGGIVVAADAPGSTVSDVQVHGNHVTGSYEGGVMVNAETGSSQTDNVAVTRNFLSGNQANLTATGHPTGVVVFANPTLIAVPPLYTAPAQTLNTVVAGNFITNEFYGIWSTTNDAPLSFGNRIQVTSGGMPIFPAPQPPTHGHSGQHGHSGNHGHYGNHGHFGNHGRHGHFGHHGNHGRR